VAGRGTWDYFWEVIGEVLSIGLAMVGSVMAGAGFGWFMDEKVFKGHTSPWFLLIGIGLGAAGGIKNVLYFQKRSQKKVK